MTSTLTQAAVFLSRHIELSVLIKATVLLLFGLTAAWVAGRSRASVRHLILTATFVALPALLLVMLAAPRLPIPIDLPGAYSITFYQPDIPTPTPAAIAGLPSASSPVPSWPTWQTTLRVARVTWIAGALLFLAPLALNLLSLRRLRRRGLPWLEFRGRIQSLADELGIRRPVEILLHEDIPAPLTCGWLHPAILLPSDARDWPAAELRCALVHELEHIRRADWATQWMARTICAAYWFHPLAWMAWRRLCLEAERACDDAVILNQERTDYAGQLVSLARRMSQSQAQPALGMANRSDLARRVSAVLDSRQQRGRAGILAAAAAVLGAALVVLAIAPVQAVAQAPTRSPRSTPINRALYEAAEEGNLADMQQLLNIGADVNAKIQGDGSPLIAAARKGRLDAVRFLLDRGANPNMPVPGDGNPLIGAASEGHAEVVTLLLDRGASINLMVPGDENALIQASGNGRMAVVKLLVARGADVNARIWGDSPHHPGGEWRSPLTMARAGRHADVVAYLLSVGARE